MKLLIALLYFFVMLMKYLRQFMKRGFISLPSGGQTACHRFLQEPLLSLSPHSRVQERERGRKEVRVGCPFQNGKLGSWCIWLKLLYSLPPSFPCLPPSLPSQGFPRSSFTFPWAFWLEWKTALGSLLKSFPHQCSENQIPRTQPWVQTTIKSGNQ